MRHVSSASGGMVTRSCFFKKSTDCIVQSHDHFRLLAWSARKYFLLFPMLFSSRHRIPFPAKLLAFPHHTRQTHGWQCLSVLRGYKGSSRTVTGEAVLRSPIGLPTMPLPSFFPVSDLEALARKTLAYAFNELSKCLNGCASHHVKPGS